jgi:dUTP pyrophosphatase
MISFMIRDEPGCRVLPPRRGTALSAGWDVYFPTNIVLVPREKRRIDLMVQVFLPVGHFGLLSLRSGAALCHDIQLLGGIIGEYQAAKNMEKN